VFFVSNTEAMFFINDDKAKVFVTDTFLYLVSQQQLPVLCCF